MAQPEAPSPSNALKHVKTRTELRAYILKQLPGWEPWLTLAAAEVQARAWDTELLKTEGELINDIRTFAAEFVDGVGPDAERMFMLFLQQRPDHGLSGDLPASEAFTTDPGQLPFSHEQLRQRKSMPSRVLIGLLGALGLRQRLMATGRRKKGRAKNVRLVWALEWVRVGLLPFVKTPKFIGRCVGDLVVPPEGQLDSTVPASALRHEPISMVLGALVAIYLSLPNRSDPEGRSRKDPTPGDPEKLKIPSTLLEETTDALRNLAKHLEQHPVHKRQSGGTAGAK